MFLTKLLLTAGTLGAVAAAAPGAAGSPQTMYFRAEARQARVVHVRPDRASVGDSRVTGGELLTDAGKPAGSYGFTCTSTAIHGREVVEHCSGEGSLAGGQLTFAGMSRSGAAEDTLAVTGGTGAYRAARGEIHVRGDSAGDDDVTIVLTD